MDAGFKIEHGFTLVELIAVIVLMGIITAVAVPRFTDRNAFDAMGYFNEARATVRYAQKVAIAERRPVCAVFTAAQVSLFYLNVPAGTCNLAPVNTPGESAAMVAVAPAGVAITPPPTNPLAFDALGQPISPAGALIATQTVTVANRTFLIETQTGYVR